MNLLQHYDKKSMIPFAKRKKHSVVDWMMMKQDDVINEFMTLKGAELHKHTKDEQFVWVPGSRKDRCLLVAHADTVVKNRVTDEEYEVSIGYDNGRLVSKNKVGIGADDRAGCAMLWKLKDLGHSLLIPCGEESGCKGSRYLMRGDGWEKLINSHMFAFEMDRRNSKDLVYYEVGSNVFRKWCGEQFPSYSEAPGSFTDIGVLCTEICGMNISVGYHNEHGSDEYLEVDEWAKTLGNLHRVLSQKKFERFVQDPPEKVEFPSHKPYDWRKDKENVIRAATQTIEFKDDYDHGDNYFRGNKNKVYDANIRIKLDSLITCSHCDLTQDQIQYKNNNDKCVRCNKGF